ncbi:hypothetical protein [Acidithiobacillus ferrianus]|nr:hypothetical protein [Acidithiobacillus ferrianus]
MAHVLLDTPGILDSDVLALTMGARIFCRALSFLEDRYHGA